MGVGEGGLARSYINTRNGIEGGLLPCGEGRRVGGLITLPHLWGQFHQRSTSSFYVQKSKKCKKDIQVVCLSCTFGI